MPKKKRTGHDRVPAAPAPKPDAPVGRVRTWSVALTKHELAHLRDMFSVKLPQAPNQTLSEALAESQGRLLCEPKLWDKLSGLCRAAGVGLEDEAPDFTLLPAGPVPLGLYTITACDDDEGRGEGEG